MSPGTYYTNRTVDRDNHDSQTSLASIPHPVGSYGASGDTEFLFSRPPHPCEHNDLPTASAHPFESGQSLSTVVQNENLCGTSPLLRSPGNGQTQHSAVRLPFSGPLLSPQPTELSRRYGRYGSHHSSLVAGISAQNDPRPSGSRVTTVSSRGDPVMMRWYRLIPNLG